MYDQKWLEMQIVRMGEKYPDRVGYRGDMGFHGNHCIIGEILCDTGRCRYGVAPPGAVDVIMDSFDHSLVAEKAAKLNDAGVPWGEIPKRLGLVPGELPAEPARETVEA